LFLNEERDSLEYLDDIRVNDTDIIDLKYYIVFHNSLTPLPTAPSLKLWGVSDLPLKGKVRGINKKMAIA
jgi:hypothetical protein